MYKRVMIVTGKRPADQAALKEGLALAKTHGSKVIFINVMPRYVMPMTDVPPTAVIDAEMFWKGARREGQKILSKAHARAVKFGIEAEGLLAAGDDDAQCIAQASRRHRCSVVVVGTEGRSALLRLMSGSVIPGLITHCTVPVLVCRPDEKPQPEARQAAAPARARTKRAATEVGRLRLA